MFKAAITLIAAALIGGCGSIANTEFDAEEVSRYVDLMTAANDLQRQCSSPEVVRALLPITESLVIAAVDYSDVKSNNARIKDAGKIVLEQVNDLNRRYTSSTPSEAYCKVKLQLISLGARTIAKSLASKELISPVSIDSEDK